MQHTNYNQSIENICWKSICLTLMLAASTNSFALSIKHVSHSPVKTIYKAGEEITVRFNLEEAADVALKIYDDREYLIRTISGGAVLKSGDHALKWDGKDKSGRIVPYEAYHYTLEANNGNETIIYDLSDLTGNEKGTLRDAKWDRESNTISYRLVRSSRVNFRVGIGDGGPLLRTVTNWQPRSQGKHVEKWSGYDESKQFNIAKIPRAQLFSNAYSLSKNTLIIGGNIQPSQYVDIKNPQLRTRNKSNNLRDDKVRVAQERVDYPVAIKLPESSRNKNDVPVYSGKIAVKIEILKTELARLHKNRFEPILFVDGQYVSELETGFFPVTWQLDTSKYKTGEHYITINIRGYNGQYGTSTQTIFIDNENEI